MLSLAVRLLHVHPHDLRLRTDTFSFKLYGNELFNAITNYKLLTLRAKTRPREGLHSRNDRLSNFPRRLISFNSIMLISIVLRCSLIWQLLDDLIFHFHIKLLTFPRDLIYCLSKHLNSTMHCTDAFNVQIMSLLKNFQPSVQWNPDSSNLQEIRKLISSRLIKKGTCFLDQIPRKLPAIGSSFWEVREIESSS